MQHSFPQAEGGRSVFHLKLQINWDSFSSSFPFMFLDAI